jgi:hypothetical protein
MNAKLKKKDMERIVFNEKSVPGPEIHTREMKFRGVTSLLSSRGQNAIENGKKYKPYPHKALLTRSHLESMTLSIQ